MKEYSFIGGITDGCDLVIYGKRRADRLLRQASGVTSDPLESIKIVVVEHGHNRSIHAVVISSAGEQVRSIDGWVTRVAHHV